MAGAKTNRSLYKGYLRIRVAAHQRFEISAANSKALLLTSILALGEDCQILIKTGSGGPVKKPWGRPFRTADAHLGFFQQAAFGKDSRLVTFHDLAASILLKCT
jgi:hypothetical protein